MENKNHKKHVLHVHGMHCEACVLLTDVELKEHSKVVSVKSNLHSKTVEVFGDFGDMTLEDVARELSGVLSKHSLKTEPEKRFVKWEEFRIAVPVAFGFIFLFVLLQKMGVVNLINTGTMSYGTAFVIGIVASLSSCMAVVGGLLLSMSATFAKEGDKWRPQLFFHGSRLVSFFVLGGVIGALGSAFQLSTFATFALSFTIGIVMLMLGVNLLDVFPKLKRFGFYMPKFISSKTFGLAKINHTMTPLLLGAATFFLPCGFTQSMQVYALGTGSFWAGALTMLSFALGTLPVLAILSFSSSGVKDSRYSGAFFKSAGLIVIMFAILNIVNSLVIVGLIRPVFNL
ncbi:MAG: hypothetical protein EXS46_02000 [Candidatus Taylorbacteria bacterium]|nr:hypothetical protein [Candidatus Taylorbacteria bacterium]